MTDLVPNTVDQPGPLDPTAGCKPGEPYFPLVGHDPDAPAAIEFWAYTRRRRLTPEMAKFEVGEEYPASLVDDLNRCNEAERLAESFREWREADLAGPAPEPVAPKRARYNDQMPTSAAADEQADRKLKRTNALADLRQAAFHIERARELFEEMGDIPKRETLMLVYCRDKVNAVADRLSPIAPRLQAEA